MISSIPQEVGVKNNLHVIFISIRLFSCNGRFITGVFSFFILFENCLVLDYNGTDIACVF